MLAAWSAVTTKVTVPYGLRSIRLRRSRSRFINAETDLAISLQENSTLLTHRSFRTQYSTKFSSLSRIGVFCSLIWSRRCALSASWRR
jgi:hypothetical protein